MEPSAAIVKNNENLTMAVIFCIGLLIYYAISLRGRSKSGRELARLLWTTYFALGCSALFVTLTGVLEPLLPPNYLSTLFFLLCVLISISGFINFNASDVHDFIGKIRGKKLIENVLVSLQVMAIVFFLPHAVSSLLGDPNENRIALASKMDVLASYGLLNTICGAASQLFPASLVMAGVGLVQNRYKNHGRGIGREIVLILASLSFVVYILAYAGRDGFVYWLMTALLVFVIFQKSMATDLRKKIILIGASVGGLMLLPFTLITVARFAHREHGTVVSLFEYFGVQIYNFSDFFSIDRPLTFGLMNFPMFFDVFFGLNWQEEKSAIFDQYLAQNQEPWIFATYISDFAGDFGYFGALILVCLLSLISFFVCGRRDRRGLMSLSRLLLVVLLFLTPYWGVFYFRFGIANSFIVINIAFIFFVWLVQIFTPQSLNR